ncbi:MAG: hypothetical protein ABIQ90_00205 [Polaromonas sp.]
MTDALRDAATCGALTLAGMLKNAWVAVKDAFKNWTGVTMAQYTGFH